MIHTDHCGPYHPHPQQFGHQHFAPQQSGYQQPAPQAVSVERVIMLGKTLEALAAAPSEARVAELERMVADLHAQNGHLVADLNKFADQVAQRAGG